MIIVKIVGGIGNQIFQYVFAKLLSKHNKNVFLDISDYRFYEDRQFDLDCFAIDLPLATSQQIAQFLPVAGRKAKTQRFFRDIFGNNYQYIKEESKQFNPQILKKYNQNTYFDGYWQAAPYVESLENIHDLLQFRNPPLPQNLLYIEKIQNTNSVAIHIRRGDYVQKPEVSQIFKVLTLDYYQKAVEEIARHFSPHFFVFSDDINWAKKHLKSIFPQTFVDLPNPNHEDLRLISLCQHQIIANSSFSWWGAYLNKNPNKIVICPQSWYHENTINNPDLIPKKWIRL